MVQTHLSHELVARFEEKGREFGTINRVYCVQPTCSRFLGPISQGTLFSGGPPIYDCPAPGCTTRTCAGCRGRYDGWTHTCRQDQGAEQVLNLGQNQGWARCPGCAQLIELNMGCFHMTCRCRTEFCYLCRARWKTCACPQWDERRLLAAAEQRVDAQLGHVRPWRRHEEVIPSVRVPLPAATATTTVPEWRRRVAQAHLSVSASTSTPAPAAPASTPAVRAQPQATTPATNHPVWRQSASANPAVGSPQQPTATPTGGSLARPSPPIVPPKPAELTRSVRGQGMIREMIERLRVDHECDHAKWKYRRGGGRCENCHVNLPLYLFRCQGCQMLVCNRCRRNRL
ncbi:hypothetical protein J3A83DRAFT_4357494 [Scleroderma citrinum]